MAVDTPVLERRPIDKFKAQYDATQAYVDCFNEEEKHNARIRDTYARLINPECKIEDVISAAPKQEEEAEEQLNVAPAQPYLVENARADAAIFRADNPINRGSALSAKTVESDALDEEEENEDLRPTPATIQYQTIDKSNAKTEIKSSASRKEHILGKKEKIIIAVFVGVVLALLTLVIVNSTIIAGLNADIANVQNEINTVRGALAGVNSSVAEIVPETVRNLLIK